MGYDRLELVHIGGECWYILGGSHRHDPIDIRQCVCYKGPASDVDHSRLMDLASQCIFGVGTGRRGAIVAFPSLHLQGPIAFPVIER